MTLYRRMLLRLLLVSVAMLLLLATASGALLQWQLARSQLQDLQSSAHWWRSELSHNGFQQLTALPDSVSPNLLQISGHFAGQSQTRTFQQPQVSPPWLSHLSLFKNRQQQQRIATSGGAADLLLVAATAPYELRWWQQWRQITGFIAVAMGILVVALMLGLRRQLQPVGQIAEHLESLSALKFDNALSVTAGPELERIAAAVNTLSNKLRWELDGHHRQLDSLKQALLTDPVSELPNRSFVTDRLNSWLRQSGEGAVVLINLKFLEAARARFGYQYRDQLVSQFAHRLRDLDRHHFGAIAARISAEDFVVLLSGDDLQRGLDWILGGCQLLVEDSSSGEPKPYGIGVTAKANQTNAEQVLAEADNALVQAMASSQPICWFPQNSDAAVCRQQWQLLLEPALKQRQFRFYGQPIHDRAGDRIQWQLQTELLVDGRQRQEQELRPYLTMLQLNLRYHKAKIRALAELEPSFTPIAVSLPLSCVQNQAFVHWLIDLLQQKPLPLRFEISESLVLNHPEPVALLRDELKNYGYPFGVVDFGLHLAGMEYISWLKPDFVKLDPGFVPNAAEPVHQQVIATMFNLLQTMNIELFVTGIEEDAQLNGLDGLPFNGYLRAKERVSLSGYRGQTAIDQSSLLLEKPLEQS